ncbi:MAG: hypothetical protein OXP69_06450 [Spirochaetaceae bacterium]|nr:hypothetical protein [Spirochaetaceae bacterium]
MAIPEVTLPIDTSGFLQGIDIVDSGFAEVKFRFCSNNGEHDLLIVRQALKDNSFTLHQAVQEARDILATTLEEVANDIRTGARPIKPIELSEEELEEYQNDPDGEDKE